MRHRVYGKKLGLDKNERTALFKSLVQELFLHGNLTTTQSKVKAIKGLVDKVINLAKNKNSQRLLQAYFSNKLLQERLIKEIVPKLGARTSGFTSTVRMGTRVGDQTMMVKMSLIGAEELKPLEKVTPRLRSGQAGNRLQGRVKKAAEVKKVVSEKKGITGQSVRKTYVTRKGTSRLSKNKK